MPVEPDYKTRFTEILQAYASPIRPIVRAGYAMMAVGCTAIVIAELAFLEWSRQALPGPTDARTQLQKAAFMITRQGGLMNAAPLWSAPAFVGIALIGMWLYRERTHAAAFVLWAAVIVGWAAAAILARSARRKLSERKRQIEQLLGDLA